jgi:beta-glucosidase-like glycosyl hydrolase
MGQELRSVGIDLDFAPVLDVLTNSANTVIGDRAFSTDPYQVALFGRAQHAGYETQGSFPVASIFLDMVGLSWTHTRTCHGTSGVGRNYCA